MNKSKKQQSRFKAPRVAELQETAARVTATGRGGLTPQIKAIVNHFGQLAEDMAAAGERINKRHKLVKKIASESKASMDELEEAVEDL